MAAPIPFDVLVRDGQRWRPVWGILATTERSARSQVENLQADERGCPRCLWGKRIKLHKWSPRKGNTT